MTAENPLADFLKRFAAVKKMFDGGNSSLPPPPECAEDEIRHAHLRPSRQPLQAQPATLLDMQALRAELPRIIANYLEGNSNKALLLKIPFGVGKTHSAVQAIQEVASRARARFLWTADRHDAHDNLARLANYQPELWYHWKPINETTCQLHEAMRVWTSKGYPSMELCLQPCRANGHLAVCPYRLQSKVVKAPIIFAMHQHLAHGLPLKNFDAVVIDEMPIRAFIAERTIAARHLCIAHHGPIGELTQALHALAQGAGNSCISGKTLMDAIGAILADVYAHVELIENNQLRSANVFPQIPAVSSMADVENAPAFYLFDFLELAWPEYAAWRAGRALWAERVKVTARGLSLLTRRHAWELLPRKRIILDATGKPEDYALIFGDAPEVTACSVQRVGKVRQVAGRVNGKSTLVENGQLTKHGREALAVLQALYRSAQNPAIICALDVVTFVSEFAPPCRILHFGDQRGSNALQDADLLIVLGVISPNEQQVVDTATALNAGRQSSYYSVDAHGRKRPAFSRSTAFYRVNADFLAQLARENEAWKDATGAERQIGSYADEQLAQIQRMTRENELLQAIHRARPNLRPCEVVILTAIPIEEEVDVIEQNPYGIEWQHWPKLLPVLEQDVITAKSLAEATGASLSYVSRQRWLFRLAELPYRQLKLSQQGRGRPTIQVVKTPKP